MLNYYKNKSKIYFNMCTHNDNPHPNSHIQMKLSYLLHYNHKQITKLFKVYK